MAGHLSVAQVMMTYLDLIFWSINAPFWWHLIIDWVCWDFYHLIYPNIPVIWHWKIYSWHWSGPMKILNDLVGIANGSPSLDIALVLQTKYIAVNLWKFISNEWMKFDFESSLDIYCFFFVRASSNEKCFRNITISSFFLEIKSTWWCLCN